MVIDNGCWVDKCIESDRNSLDVLCEKNEFVLFDNCVLSRSIGRRISGSDSVELERRWMHLLGEKLSSSFAIYLTRKIFGEYIAGIGSHAVCPQIKSGMRRVAEIVEEERRLVSPVDVEMYAVCSQNIKPLSIVCGLSEVDHQFLTMGIILSDSDRTAIVTNDAGIIKAYSLIREQIPDLSVWSRLSNPENKLQKVNDIALYKMKKRKMEQLVYSERESEKKRVLERAGFSYKSYQHA